MNFVLVCSYNNDQHDPLPPTAEAAWLVQQRTYTIITKHRQTQWKGAHENNAAINATGQGKEDANMLCAQKAKLQNRKGVSAHGTIQGTR